MKTGFMIRVDSLTARATFGYNIGFDKSGSTTELNSCLYIKKVSSNTFNLGINKTDSATYNSTAYNINTTYFVVVKYSFVAGTNNDSTKMYVFTSGVPSTEPTVPTAFAVNGFDLPDEGEIFLSNGYAQDSALAGSSVKYDGIRIATSWNSVITGVSIISSEIPSVYRLGQNYPNPFNPSTNFEFRIGDFGLVSLTIYNSAGEVIKSLINRELSPGIYHADWEASSYPSGVYFYKLTAKGFTETKKMILIK